MKMFFKKQNKTTKKKIISTGGSRTPDLWRERATRCLLRHDIKLMLNIKVK